MKYTENALNFSCLGQSLVGVASLPEAPHKVGVLIIVGGPQYRAGSHRQFVQLARRAATEGHAVLRFDCRGMGDSTGDPRTFEDISPDIAAAVQALLLAAPAVQEVVLWGLCDGASAALLYLGDSAQDPRVAGLCLVNPWVRSQATLARTHVKHYYTQRLRQPEFWAKLLRGGVAWQALGGLARSLRLAAAGAKPTAANADADLPYTKRMALQWQRFDGPILLLLSGNDFTAQEFKEAWQADPAWQTAPEHSQLDQVELAGADHTLSTTESRLALEGECLRWLAKLDRAARHPAISQSLSSAPESVHAV